MSHFWAILITFSLRPQEFSAHLAPYFIFFPSSWQIHRNLRLFSTIAWHMWLHACMCVLYIEGVVEIMDAFLLLELTCGDHEISHTRYILISCWVVYIPGNTWGFNETPTLTFQRCVIILLSYVKLFSQWRPHGIISSKLLCYFQ